MNKKRNILILTVLLFTTFIISSLTAKEKTLVVVNFTSIKSDQELGAAISELFRGMVTTINQKEYIIIEREQLNKIMKEQELSLSGAVDEKESEKIGKLLAADYIILGSISKTGNTYTINARIVDSSTSKIVQGSTISSNSENELPEKVKTLAYLIFKLEVPENKASAAKDNTISKSSYYHEIKKSYTYDSVYSDGSGDHPGGKIIFKIDGNNVTGQSIESYGTAELKGQISGNKIVGYYKASYGYGNFEFNIVDNLKKIEGTYYQVSNGANGKWVGELSE